MRVCVRVPEELPGPPFVLPNSYLAVCYGLPYITYDCTNSAEEFFFFSVCMSTGTAMTRLLLLSLLLVFSFIQTFLAITFFLIIDYFAWFRSRVPSELVAHLAPRRRAPVVFLCTKVD